MRLTSRFGKLFFAQPCISPFTVQQPNYYLFGATLGRTGVSVARSKLAHTPPMIAHSGIPCYEGVRWGFRVNLGWWSWATYIERTIPGDK